MIKNLTYELLGIKSPTIVFLHGWGMNGNSFDKVISGIKADQQMLKLDFFSFGTSDKAEEYFDTYEYAYHVFLLIKKLNINRIILVGHSFGGRVAMILSSVFDINVESCVLTSSAGINRFSLCKELKIIKYKIIKFLIKKKILSNNVLSNYGSSDYKKLNQSDKQVFIRIINQDLKYLVKKIKSNVLLVWDKKDDITPYWICKYLYKTLINKNIILYKNGKHFAFLYNINKFTKLLNNLI